jgi:uncharacterized protein
LSDLWRQAAVFPLVFLIRAYQLLISPLFPGSCRFRPTCSAYAIDVLRMHGLFRGGWLALTRIGRCHPWGEHGWDPAPKILVHKWRKGRGPYSKRLKNG